MENNNLLVGMAFLLFLLANPVEVNGQGSIGTERPTFSTSTYTIPANSFQFEQGVIFWNDTTVLDGMFRAAVSKRAEIRLFTAYGENSTLWGAKVNVLQKDGFKPGVSIQGSFGDLTKLANFRFSYQQKISDKLGATVNVGKAVEYFGILALGYSLGDKLGVYVEGFYKSNYQLIDAGLTYLLNDETQIDLSAGGDTSNNAYLSAGISRRFLYKN